MPRVADPRRRLPGGAAGQPPSGRVLVAVVGMPRCLPAVHRRSVSTWVSTQPGPPVRGPGVQPSGVQPVRCPIIWLPRPDAAVRPSGRPVSSPSGVQRLVSVRPPGRSRLVPRQPGGGDGDTSVRRAAVTTGSSRVPCGPAPSPAARSTARGGMDAGTAAEVVWRPAGERRRRTRAGVCPGGRLHRPTGQARPPRGAPVAGDCARAGELVEARRCPRHRVGRPSGLEPRLLFVVDAEPNVRVDGPGVTNELGGEDGARPQRGPAR